MATGQEWTFMVLLMVCFISAGIFGGVALWTVMNQKKKPLYWSIPLAFMSMIAFMMIMFYLLF